MPKKEAGTSIKIRNDTLAVLAALRGRLGFGHSYDALIQELVKRQIEGTTSAAMAGDRLQRVEEIVTQILLLLEDKNGGGAPPKMTIT